MGRPPVGASGGQILVTNRVHSAVEARVEASSLGDMDGKGFSRPVSTLEVSGRR